MVAAGSNDDDAFTGGPEPAAYLVAVTVLLLVGLGTAGLLIGSFLNVVIVRLPVGHSVVRPRSHCPECGTTIQARDEIPVVSWVLLRGRCRTCAEPIPAGYPLVEAGNALLWVLAGIRFGAHAVVLPYLFLFSVLLAQSVIDLELYRLLDRITFPAVAVSAVALTLVAFTLHHPSGAILGAVIGSAGYFLFLFIPALAYPTGMGLGDVKLAILMGLYLGFIHPILALYAIIIACLMGIIAGVLLFFVRGRTSRGFPFGPWLALGCVVAILFSGTLLGDLAT